MRACVQMDRPLGMRAFIPRRGGRGQGSKPRQTLLPAPCLGTYQDPERRARDGRGAPERRAVCVFCVSCVRLMNAGATRSGAERGRLIKGFVHFLFNLTVMNEAAEPIAAQEAVAAVSSLSTFTQDDPGDEKDRLLQQNLCLAPLVHQPARTHTHTRTQASILVLASMISCLLLPDSPHQPGAAEPHVILPPLVYLL